MRRELAGLLVASTALIATSGVSKADHLLAAAMPEPRPIRRRPCLHSSLTCARRRNAASPVTTSEARPPD